MNGIPTIDPGSGEIQSPLIAGISEGLNKVSSAMNITEGVLTDFQLEEVYITSVDRYRIYQAPNGKRLWDSNIVVKINGVVTSPEDGHFTINYVGGSISFETEHRRVVSDVITVSGNYADVITSGSPAKLGELYITSNKNFSDPNFLLADGSEINQPDYPEYFDVVLDKNKLYYVDSLIFISAASLTRLSTKIIDDEIFVPRKGGGYSVIRNGEFKIVFDNSNVESVAKKGNYFYVLLAINGGQIRKYDLNFNYLDEYAEIEETVTGTSTSSYNILYLPKRDILILPLQEGYEWVCYDEGKTWNKVEGEGKTNLNTFDKEVYAGYVFQFADYTLIYNPNEGNLYCSKDEYVFINILEKIGVSFDITNLGVNYNIIDNKFYVFTTQKNSHDSENTGQVYVSEDLENWNRIQNEITEGTVHVSSARTDKFDVIGLKYFNNKYYALVAINDTNNGYLRDSRVYELDTFDENTKKPNFYYTLITDRMEGGYNDYEYRTKILDINNNFYLFTCNSSNNMVYIDEISDIHPRIKLPSFIHSHSTSNSSTRDADAVNGANVYVKVLE